MYIDSMDKTPKPFKEWTLKEKIKAIVAYGLFLNLIFPVWIFVLSAIFSPYKEPSETTTVKLAYMGIDKAIELYDSGKGKVKEKIKEFHKKLHESP